MARDTGTWSSVSWVRLVETAWREVGFLGMSIWSETSRLVNKSLFLRVHGDPEFTKLAVLVRHEVMVKPGGESALGQLGGADLSDGLSVRVQGQVDTKN